MQTQISFSFPLRKKEVRNLKIVTVQYGTLEIEAIATAIKGGSRFDPLDEQFKIDLEVIRFEGREVPLPVLLCIGDEVSMEDIYKKALEEAAHCFYYPYEPLPVEDERVPVFMIPNSLPY